MTPPVAVDLFCGCGGLTLGLKQAGFRVAWAVDSDSLAVETYRVNHPDVLVRECDIRSLEPHDVLRTLRLRIGELDLVAGCPPCQGFSKMRTLNGARSVTDEKNDLVFEFLRFVSALQPKTVMMENVPGLADDLRFAYLVAELERAGYTTEHRILNTVNFGVPQRRRRLVLLAGRGGPIRFAPPAVGRRTVRDAIESLPAVGYSDDPLHDLRVYRTPKVIEVIRRIPVDGGSRRHLPEWEQLPCHRNFAGFKDVYGRMAWDQPSPTITGGCTNPSKGRFLHPTYNRAISLREAALLQGFPPDYFFSLRQGQTGASQLIGNALPPEFVRRHAVGLTSHVKTYDAGPRHDRAQVRR